MSTAFKTYEQMISLAAKHDLLVEVVVLGEYRISTKTTTRRRRALDLDQTPFHGTMLFQGTVGRCGDFLQGYDRAPK